MSNAPLLKLRKMFSTTWIYEERFQRKLPRFFDQFDKHVLEYVELHGIPLEVLVEAVRRIHDVEISAEAKKIYSPFREYLESRILISNAAPRYDQKPTSMVPGHGTYPGSFESGKKR